MRLSQARLEAAFKRYGLEYTFDAEFATRGLDRNVASTIKGAVAHYTAGAKTGNLPSGTIVRHGRPGLRNSLANLMLARDGTVVGIAAGVCWHAGVGSWHGLTAGNSHLVGIEAESTGAPGDWTPSQIEAYPRLLAALRDEYGYASEWNMAHYQWAKPEGRKIDVRNWPGGMDALRGKADLLFALAHRPRPVDPAKPPKPGGAVVPPAVPKPGKVAVVKYRLKRKLVVDGKFGGRTIKALQKALRVTIDGVYGKRSRLALQHRLGVKADGVIGPQTVGALNRELGLTGRTWTPSTTAALQRRLNAGTF